MLVVFFWTFFFSLHCAVLHSLIIVVGLSHHTQSPSTLAELYLITPARRLHYPALYNFAFASSFCYCIFIVNVFNSYGHRNDVFELAAEPNAPLSLGIGKDDAGRCCQTGIRTCLVQKEYKWLTALFHRNLRSITFLSKLSSSSSMGRKFVL